MRTRRERESFWTLTTVKENPKVSVCIVQILLQANSKKTQFIFWRLGFQLYMVLFSAYESLLLKAWKLFWNNALYFALQSVLWGKKSSLFSSASKDSAHKLLRGNLEFIWKWFCKLLIVYENLSISALFLPYLVHICNFFGVCYM